MMNFILILPFLFTFSWTTEEFEFHSVLVQPGEDVTLLSTNLSRNVQHILWFKLIDGSNVSLISSILFPGSEARLSDGFQCEKFNMTSNVTHIFLNIKQVNFSDSGFYICGLKSAENYRIFRGSYLQVKVVDGSDAANNLPTVILGGVVFLLAIIILVLVLKNKPCHAGQTNIQNQQHNENLDSDAVNYAALNFRPKANRNGRPSAERETDPNVLYAATR